MFKKITVIGMGKKGAFLLRAIRSLQSEIRTALPSYTDTATRYHLQDLLDRINGKSGSFGPAIEQYQEPEKPDSKVESSLSQRLEGAFKSTEVKHAPDEEEEQVEMAPFEDQKEIEAEPEQVDEVEEQSEVDEMQAEVEPEPVEPEEANEPDAL